MYKQSETAYRSVQYTETCNKILARALQGLSDPYCQSTCVCVGNFDAKYIEK